MGSRFSMGITQQSWECLKFHGVSAFCLHLMSRHVGATWKRSHSWKTDHSCLYSCQLWSSCVPTGWGPTSVHTLFHFYELTLHSLILPLVDPTSQQEQKWSVGMCILPLTTSSHTMGKKKILVKRCLLWTCSWPIQSPGCGPEFTPIRSDPT